MFYRRRSAGGTESESLQRRRITYFRRLGCTVYRVNEERGDAAQGRPAVSAIDIGQVTLLAFERAERRLQQTEQRWAMSIVLGEGDFKYRLEPDWARLR